MSGDIYENDKQNIVADCVLCKEQIELECEPYFEIGAIYHHPNGIYHDEGEVRGFTHEKCHREIQEGLGEALQLLIDQIAEEGEVLGFSN